MGQCCIRPHQFNRYNNEDYEDDDILNEVGDSSDEQRVGIIEDQYKFSLACLRERISKASKKRLSLTHSRLSFINDSDSGNWDYHDNVGEHRHDDGIEIGYVEIPIVDVEDANFRPFDLVPNELLIEIFSTLDAKSLCIIGAVCRRFYLVTQSFCKELWSPLCDNRGWQYCSLDWEDNANGIQGKRNSGNKIRHHTFKELFKRQSSRERAIMFQTFRPIKNGVELSLLFSEARSTILRGDVPCDADHVIRFAAVQIRAMGMSIPMVMTTMNTLGKTTTWRQFVPERALGIRNLADRVREASEDLEEESEVDAQLRYIIMLRVLNRCGVTFFQVKEPVEEQFKLVPRWLGLTHDSIIRSEDPLGIRVLSTWYYPSVVRWRNAASTFSIDVLVDSTSTGTEEGGVVSLNGQEFRIYNYLAKILNDDSDELSNELTVHIGLYQQKW